MQNYLNLYTKVLRVDTDKITKSCKMAVSFVLSNADFPSLPTVSKLHSTSINPFPNTHNSNKNIVTPFLKNILPISKNFVPASMQYIV